MASLNYLLTSHVWRQDHNGFSHQDPGFIDHVVNKKAVVVRVYLPPDTNTLLSVADHCLRSRDYVNVIVAGKNPAPDWLDMDSAVLHCTRGAGIWEWAGTDTGSTDPDVVLACAGDVPTLEVLAATDILRRHVPGLKVRVVNVVDLMRLQPETEHPHGMGDHEFDALFTTDRPIIFAYHGYPWLIHRLTYRRTGHHNIHVRGYKENGTTTTPFDMVVMNDMDRYHLVMDVIDRVPGLGQRAAALRQHMVDTRARHHAWTREYGEDLPEVRDWVWPYESPVNSSSVPHARPLMRVLVVNTGSSSLKLRLLGPDDHLDATLDLQPWRGDTASEELVTFTRRLAGVGAVGHRVVHGGDRFTAATLIDDGVVKAIATLSDLAPAAPAACGLRDRNGARAAARRPACRVLRYGVPRGPAARCRHLRAAGDLAGQVRVAALRLSRALARVRRTPRGPDADRRRGGFPGRGASPREAAPQRSRVVVCHLGAGASLAAVHGGRSVDTTMGFTPMEGLVMATRAGSLDPGLLIWLLQHGGVPLAEVADKLEHEAPGSRAWRSCQAVPATCVTSGWRRRPGTHARALALDVYIHRLRREIAAMAAAMDGLDVLVFTGGIGEHAAGGARGRRRGARVPRRPRRSRAQRRRAR